MNREPFFIENVLFDLLRISLWGDVSRIDYRSLTDEEWWEVYRLSGQQGVRCIVFGGVSLLPEKMQPNEKLLFSWAANTVLAKEKSLHYLKTTIQLNELFAAEGIEMLLLKGSLLASFYPIPEYREYGDIDIYLFGEYDRGDTFLKKHANLVKKIEKHTTFIFQGIPIENHKTFIDHIKSRDIFSRKRKEAFEYMEISLHKILKREQKHYLEYYDIRVPSPTFNFLFMVIHTGTHLGKELVVRHLCDWSCFLEENKGKYDEKIIEYVLNKMNFKQLCLIMTDVAIRDIGMPVEFAPSFYKKGDRKRINARFVNSLFEYFPGSNEVEKNTLSCKWKRFCHNQWAYDLFEKEYLPERLCRTILIWIKEEWKRIESQ